MDSISPSPESIASLLSQAIACHEAGQLAEAGRIYRAILGLEPRHTQANYNLGVLALQQQDAQRARPHFLAALHSDPGREQCWLACIEALLQAGRPAAAAALLQEALQRLGEGEALQALAARVTAQSAGKDLRGPDAEDVSVLVAQVGAQEFAAAEALARELHRYFPRDAFVCKALGVALEGLGRLDEARQAMRQALELQPADAECLCNLGNVCKALGRLDEAQHCYRQALELAPELFAAHLNLAALHLAQGRSEAAQDAYRKALDLRPGSAEACNGLGVALQGLGRHAEAEACYRRALMLNDGLANAYKNLGTLLSQQGLSSEAVRLLERALELVPEQADVLACLGWVQARIGQLVAAVENSRRAIALAPDLAAGHASLAVALLKLGRSAEAEAACQSLLALEPENASVRQMRLFALTHDAECSAEALFREHVAFGEYAEARMPTLPPLSVTPAEAGRRLRIGFVSGDFCAHPVAFFLEPILRHLDRTHFELHAYSTGCDEDATTERLRELVDGWRQVETLSDAALAAQIREDGIDILFDLAGHTEGNRLTMFALKPAPVQASWIGYPATTGLRAVDYYLVDRHCAPPGLLDDQFTEKLVRLPTIAAFQQVGESPEVNALPALQQGFITFGSFNRMNKLNDATLDLWCRVLQAVPQGRMLIGAVEDGAAPGLIARFESRGIASQRLLLRPRMRMAEYLRLHHEVDMLLDAQPFSGWTVTNHALWMGVPTLMVPGRTLTGRACLGNLHALGLDAFIAHDADDYVHKAVAWSRNPQALAQIRAGLRARIGAAGQGAHRRVVAAVELALRQMWQRRCAGEVAASFEVSSEAVDAYLPLRADPQVCQPLTAEGEVALQRCLRAGRYAEVEVQARSLTEHFPRQSFGWRNLVAALRGLGREAELLEPLQRLAELQPRDAEVQYNLGVQWLNLQRLDDAEACLRRALELDSQGAPVWHALGRVEEKQGCLAKAEQSYRRALALEPGFASAANALGVLLNEQGRLVEADEAYRHALSHVPGHVPTLSNRGKNLTQLGRLDEAEACLREALALQPEHAQAHCNLAVVLTQQNRLVEAEVFVRQALVLRADFTRARLNLILLLVRQGRRDEARKEQCALLEHDPYCCVARSDLLFDMTHDASVSAQALFAAHRLFGELLEERLPAAPLAHANVRDERRPLRIGFVSADFREHPVAYFLEPVLRHLDRTVFETYAYSNHLHEDEVTLRLRSLVDRWHPVASMSDVALAAQIRADGIDILFDLAGHTGENRLPMFALKPAPLQVSWIGYPATTGLRAMDYYIVDRHCAPPGLLDEQFSEALVRLPAIAAFQPAASAPPVNALPALARGDITFGSFNRLGKIGDSALDLWCRVLQALPRSRMLLGAIEPHEVASLQERFAARGINVERLQIHPPLPLADYLALHHEVDMLLDTHPFSGWTVTNHALWMGVPTLMLPGATLPGRACVGNLRAVGLEEFIAADADDYVCKAVAWSRRPAELAAIRAGLRARIGISGQGAHAQVAMALESALRQMWQRWCRGQAPAALEITG